MKQAVALIAVSLVLSASAAAAGGKFPRPTMKPATPGVTLVTCAPRTDGPEGYLCVEQRPSSPKAVAFTYLVKTDAGLFGARIPQPRR